MNELVTNAMESWGWETVNYQHDDGLNNTGIDIAFKDPKWKNFYTGKVKSDLSKYGSFYIFENTLNVKADRIFHVNPVTGWVVWYGVPKMKEFFNSNKGFYSSNGVKFLKVNNKNKPGFVSTRKIK